MSITDHPKFLRTVLLIDAATCVATGALMSLAAGPLAEITRIPAGLLLLAGLSLFPIAAFMAFVATRPAPPPAGVWLVIAGNAGWVAASIWLLLGGPIDPNVLGMAFIAVQAVAVAVLAELELVGLRRQSAAA